MTRKDFQAIAAALASRKPVSQDGPHAMRVWADTVNALCDVCRRSNVAFDADRFLAAATGDK